jgi:hypothetical protein
MPKPSFKNLDFNSDAKLSLYKQSKLFVKKVNKENSFAPSFYLLTVGLAKPLSMAS